MKTKILFHWIFLFTLLQQALAQTQEYGLSIQTYPHSSKEYTVMVLDDGNPIETEEKEITLSFQLCPRNENLIGSIFRAITDQGRNIDLMYSVSKDDKHFPMLVVGDDIHPISAEIKCGVWEDVTLTVRPKDGEIRLQYGKSFTLMTVPEVKGVQSLKISFGYCPFQGYVLGDVASVNLKDIKMSRNRKPIRHWKLQLHRGDDCYDELQGKRAKGSNAKWIWDERVSWKPVFHQIFSKTPSIAFDAETGTFYLAMDKKKLYVFHPATLATDSIAVKGGDFVVNDPNQLIYIAQRKQLLAYNLDENLYSAFNFTKQLWENSRPPAKDHDYWNNTLSYHEAGASLVSFGGYGHYHFNNELLISYPYAPDKPQKRIHLKEIHPRYSPASAVVGNTFYILGGRGCPSGKQELSPRNYYDLYAVDLLTLQVTRLWEAPQPESHRGFLPSQNMIYDEKEKCFYFFSNHEGGTLMRTPIERPEFEMMSLPVQDSLDAQYGYFNLYYSQKASKLYAVIEKSWLSGKSCVDFYEMDYPPVPLQSVEQPMVTEEGKTQQAGKGLMVALKGIATLLTVIALIIFYRKRKKQVTASPASAMEEETPQAPSVSFDADIVPDADLPQYHNYDRSKGCICFFGGFKVMNKDGEDITSAFTPTLKALLILLILSTGKDPKGIVGHKMIQLLWFDKSEEAAKNNRNVCLSKLRSLLEQVGSVKITNKNGFWNIQFEDGAFCDYLEALQFYQENDPKNLEKLIELLLCGSMLPNTEIDWIDPYKNDFSNNTIDLLSRLLKREDLSDAFRLRIADTLFQHDYINEEALQAKCLILCRQKKKGLAKTVYDSFCKEYLLSLGTEYPVALKDILSSNLY